MLKEVSRQRGRVENFSYGTNEAECHRGNAERMKKIFFPLFLCDSASLRENKSDWVHAKTLRRKAEEPKIGTQ
jgi:hypothetical protein